MQKSQAIVASALASGVSLPVWPAWTEIESWHLLLHVAGAVLFFSSIVAMSVRVFLAWRQDEREAMELAIHWIPAVDVWGVLVAVNLLATNGAFLAVPVLPDVWPWLVPAVVCFLGSGAIWWFVLTPVRQRLEACCARGGDLDEGLRTWFRWGGVALALPLVTLGLMIAKVSG